MISNKNLQGGYNAYVDTIAQLERERDEEKAKDPIERAAQPTADERKKLAALVLAEAEAEGILQAAQAEHERARAVVYKLIEQKATVNEYGGYDLKPGADPTAAKHVMYDAAEDVRQAELALTSARARRNSYELALSDIKSQRRLAAERKAAKR